MLNLRYIKKYPLSLLVILTVAFLSFFKPPRTGLDSVAGIDKVVHVCMYLGMSGVLWLEFVRAHRREGRRAHVWHAWVGATLCPVLFSGAVELLQEYCTSYRGGEWADFAANAAGVLLASLAGRFVLMRRG